MGILHRFLWHRPRKRRRKQSYQEYRKARERREGYAARYAAEHPKQADPARIAALEAADAAYRARHPKPSFQATIRLQNGTEHTCPHDHRTEDAAQACGERMAREFQQARSKERPPASR